MHSIRLRSHCLSCSLSFLSIRFCYLRICGLFWWLLKEQQQKPSTLTLNVYSFHSADVWTNCVGCFHVCVYCIFINACTNMIQLVQLFVYLWSVFSNEIFLHSLSIQIAWSTNLLTEFNLINLIITLLVENLEKSWIHQVFTVSQQHQHQLFLMAQIENTIEKPLIGKFFISV